MIGALSIVRFRHPVKSALELIMYFDLITIGIATSVRTMGNSTSCLHNYCNFFSKILQNFLTNLKIFLQYVF